MQQYGVWIRIELYTGPYAEMHHAGCSDAVLREFATHGTSCAGCRQGVNAGHDLSQTNLGVFLGAVPDVLEVSIGHALISEALYEGLIPTSAPLLGYSGFGQPTVSMR